MTIECPFCRSWINTSPCPRCGAPIRLPEQPLDDEQQEEPHGKSLHYVTTNVTSYSTLNEFLRAFHIPLGGTR